ncbi:MAG: hypothetical protein AB4911_24665 [Oscillochloridaceae bacterium umkhey_bin13]
MSQLPMSPDRPVRPVMGQPQLFFFCELASSELYAYLQSGALLHTLATHSYGLALATRDLTAIDAAVVRLLNQHQIPVVAWLILPPSEGVWFNLQNYPQALEHYTAFQTWARAEGLQFAAIGLDFEPPSADLDRIQHWGAREVLRRIWLARENVLFASARTAYTELIARIHHDGYEVHTYQLPFLADDRRAGTTLAQRALDILDLPVDLEVLMCYSSAPIETLGHDLGGALITSYGPTADSIAVGTLSGSTVRQGSAEGLPALSWAALERDLLLAANYTDTIYVYSLEGCLERDLLPRLTSLNWSRSTQPVLSKRVLVSLLRSSMLVGLLTARFSRTLLAWSGWILFLGLLFRRWHERRR